MKKFYHIESTGSVKGVILTEDHSEAMKFYNDCKEQKATIAFTILNEKQAEAYKNTINQKANAVLIGETAGSV